MRHPGELLGLAGILIGLTPGPVLSQMCHGSPQGISVAYEHGTTSGGTSDGVVATLRSIQLGARVVEAAPTISGQEGSLRFALGIGTSRFQVCPILGASYRQETWDYLPTASLDMKTITIRGGGGVGFMQPVYKDLAINPFLTIQYQFSATKFESASSDGEFTADTLSDVEIEYGVVAHYRFLYAGIAAHRLADDEGTRPYLARWILGFSISGLRKSTMRHELPKNRINRARER